MKLYKQLADWWQFFSPVEEYAEEAASFIKILRENCDAPIKKVLELGRGAGGNAFYLKKEFEMTLVDLSPEMLDQSRRINPSCKHIVSDMRFVRLKRQFDAVFIHDAICYMTTEADLLRTIETAFVHCKPGGTVVIAPDHLRETFQPTTEHGGDTKIETAERAMRWLMWTFDANPDDAIYDVHFAFIFKEGETVTVEHDHHTEGLFARAVWRQLIEKAGFDSLKIITDLYDREVFVARKRENN